MLLRDIPLYRLVSQQVVRSACLTPADVVSRLGAIQAQDYNESLWAVGSRLPRSTKAQIEQTIEARTIVRTWPMRGTLHFVAAADVYWMLELLTPRIIARSAGRHRQLELTDTIFDQSRSIIEEALMREGQLTRDQIYALLQGAGIATEAQRGYHILCKLAQERVICLSSRHGKQPTFALLGEWIPDRRLLSREEALGELALRYFAGHGPATLQDFLWWSGLKSSDARMGLESVSAQLVRVRHGEIEYWLSQETARATLSSARKTTCLLPGFDEFLIGYKDRSAVLGAEHSSKITPGNNGVFQPIIVRSGRVVGTWKRSVKRDAADVIPQSFAPMDQAEETAFHAAAARYRKFLGFSTPQSE